MVILDGSDDAVEDMLRRIQLHVLPRRVRCKEFFNNFDPLRCGRCTEANFSRAINNMGVTLTEDESVTLAEAFTEHGPKVMRPAVVNYVAFCEFVDQIFSSNDLQDTLRSTSLTTSPGSTVMSTFVPNTLEDEDRFLHLLHRLASLCKARGVDIKPIYTDHDRAPMPNPSMLNNRRGGKVTKEQFKRSWPFKKEMSLEEIEILCERYRTKGGDVHYMALHNEISEVMADPAQPFPTSPLHLRPDPTEWSHSSTSVVDRIRAKIAEKKARLKEHFQDFDPLRKGLCSPGQVKTVFTIMNISKEIDKHDFESLLSQYTGDDGQFNYKAFCSDVDSAFTVPGLERSPLATLEMPDASTTAVARRNTMRLSSSKTAKLGKVEDRLRSLVRRRRLEMKPMFQDFDRPNRGYVSRNQFQRILSTMGLDLDEKSVGLLCGMYCDYGNHNDFNYGRFLKAVDPINEDVEIAMMQMTSPHSPYKAKPYFDSMGRTMGKSMSSPVL